MFSLDKLIFFLLTTTAILYFGIIINNSISNLKFKVRAPNILPTTSSSKLKSKIKIFNLVFYITFIAFKKKSCKILKTKYQM